MHADKPFKVAILVPTRIQKQFAEQHIIIASVLEVNNTVALGNQELSMRLLSTALLLLKWICCHSALPASG